MIVRRLGKFTLSTFTDPRHRKGGFLHLCELERPALSTDDLAVRPASDFDRIAPCLALWHGYDPAVKAELYSTCLLTSDGACLIDPIPLESKALRELVGS